MSSMGVCEYIFSNNPIQDMSYDLVNFYADALHSDALNSNLLNRHFIPGEVMEDWSIIHGIFFQTLVN